MSDKRCALGTCPHGEDCVHAVSREEKLFRVAHQFIVSRDYDLARAIHRLAATVRGAKDEGRE